MANAGRLRSVLASVFVPGLGQFLLKHRGRGAVIFLTTLGLIFLILWGLAKLQIGSVTLGGFTTSWLWLPLALFWLWNVLDARALDNNRRFSLLPAIFLSALIVYVIAWNVTDVKLDRLSADYCETVLNLPDMIEWIEAAKAEPMAVEELEAEF